MASTRPRLATRRGPEFTRIHGVGDYRPARVVPNSEIIEPIDSSDEWIRERSGIASRRRAAADESVVDMGREAGRAAIEAAGITPDQIGTVLVSTVTYTVQTPAAAPLIAHQLGLGDVAAFDISAACAGYCYGIGLADDIVRSGRSDYVLVIGVEKLSDFTKADDRGTAFIFGDGAGAAVVGPSDFPGIGPTVWGSDGSGYDLIIHTPDWMSLKPYWDDPTLEPRPPWQYFAMAGPSVFRWASFQMGHVVNDAVTAAGITVDDLDVFIPHQANVRIIDAMVKKLKLPEHVTVAKDDIVDVANTSAASVPLATARLMREGKVKTGDIALQMGFGAGLVYAAQVVVLP
jgi:3-oxoacyl-[acyl-carrier-protein] synthase III